MKIKGISPERTTFEDLIVDNDMTLVIEQKYLYEKSDETYRASIEGWKPAKRIRRLAASLVDPPFDKGQKYGKGDSVDAAIENYLRLLSCHRCLVTEEWIDPPRRLVLPDNLIVDNWKALREQCMAAIRKHDLEQRAARRAFVADVGSPQG